MEPETSPSASSRPIFPSIRAAPFLQKAGLDLPPQVPCLVELPTIDFDASLSDHADAARALLVQHRITRPEYRHPARQRRDLIRLPQQKKAARDEASWTFTKYEVAHTFAELLSREPLAPTGTAQALLSYASVSSLDELWSHFHDVKLEKRMSSRFRRSKASLVPEIPWLDHVTDQENVDYVRLMCQANLNQKALDRAFVIALTRRSMNVLEMLLTFKACASACQDSIRELIRHDDLPLARLLLAAHPRAMSIEAWRHCLYEEVTDCGKQPPSILLLCLANRPDIVCGPLLLHALSSQNFLATAALLAYAQQESGLGDFAQSACELASRVEDTERRYQFFTLLADSGLVVDSVTVRDELMTDVKSRHFPLLQLLVDAGVALDLEPHNAVTFAVSRMDLEVLQCFQKGNYHKPAALALAFTPDSAPEPQLLQLVEILAPRRLHGTPLDNFLVRSARKQHAELAEKLLGLGASVEYESAWAIQTAVTNVDFDILEILLKGPCSAAILSTVLPTAMAMQSRPSRRRALEMIIEKGVLRQELGVSLQSLISEAEDIDSDLVKVLLQHGAPVEGVGDDTTNAILQTTRRCNLAVLMMLCDAGPGFETLSKAIPIAFAARHSHGDDAAMATMRLLLERGAAGTPLHETLLVATTVYQLDVVCVLVDHGADANFANGAAFGTALKRVDPKLLEILCLGCPPSRGTTESVLYVAIDPQYYRLEALDLLLRSTQSSGAALDAAWNSTKLSGNPNLNTIIPCFLQYGLNADLQGGSVLCFAVQERDISLLSRILSLGPSLHSLAAAFKLTTSVETQAFELDVMSLLLESAQSAEIGQSKELLQQTFSAFSGDFVGLELLLRHMAAVDFDDGAAVCVAASVGDMKVLSYLLMYGPAVSTLHGACLAAADSPTLDFDQKRPVFDSLLDARDRELTEADKMAQLLADSVTQLPSHTQLPVLLITRGVKVHFDTLKVAVRTSSRDLFEVLVEIQNATTITEIFKEARVASMAAERRYWIYEFLLGRGVSRDEISIALIASLPGDELSNLSFPKLLLEHGAAVDYRECAAFDRALRANAVIAVQLLSQYLLDDDTACVAFDLARKTTTLSPNVRTGVYTCLLHWNISAPSIYAALVSNLEGGNADVTVIEMLLAKGADPNEEAARCFVLAATAGAELVFRTLSKYADLCVVLRALMNHFRVEWEVLLWFNTCLEEQHYSATIDEHDLLYQCMRMFPAGTGLLEVLLDRGVSPAAPTQKAFAADGQLEQCTPLIWALLATHNVDNDTILTLLSRGGHEALPMYLTPRTGVTAAFVCLLDGSRTPILEALLSLDRERTLRCSTPASTFRYFGAGLKHYVSDHEDGLPIELPLRTACVSLGNIEAYRALNCEETPDDGSLHVAAFMALPSFVEWLLNFHDPNARVVEEFGQMVPLALACTPLAVSWCKIASQAVDFATRRKQCIMLLAPRTNLSWRYRNKTVLHFALESGLEVTRIMVEALNLCRDPERNDNKYLYQDKAGIQYSPDEYVQRIMKGITNNERELLVRYLHENKIQPRYFRRVMPGEGDQPPGYHGLPPGLAKAWKSHEHDLRTLPSQVPH